MFSILGLDDVWSSKRNRRLGLWVETYTRRVRTVACLPIPRQFQVNTIIREVGVWFGPPPQPQKLGLDRGYNHLYLYVDV